MTQPCVQGERLVKAEITLKQVVSLLREQKELGAKTYEVLASISLQGEQIKSLITTTSELKHDLEVAFKSIRRIDLRHSNEDGAAEVEEEHEAKQQKFWDGVQQQFTVPALMGVCFIIWLSDKFNVIQKIVGWIKEMKG